MQTEHIDWNEIAKTLVFEQDCTKDAPRDKYFEFGKTRVVHSPIGSYREAAEDGARFGYRFSLRTIGKPHLLVLRYPDDKTRYMCIQNGLDYDLSVGVTTGYNNPCSGKMQTLYNVFIPRRTEENLMIACHNVPPLAPAAVASFAVYELDEWPQGLLPEECDAPNKRSFGIQYEDPCGVGTSEGAKSFPEFIERHIRFMRMSGQNRLIYPINWYHGPIIPVESQPNGRFYSVSCEDGTTYTRYAFQAPDWVEDVLTRFDEEGFRFTGSMTLMRLGGLFPHLVTDAEAVRAGADTVGQVAFDGTVQRSTNDWTTLFNPIAFPDYEQSCINGTPMRYAYGEESGTGLTAPIFNPLHPEVQRQVLTYIDEIAKRYARHPSFEGISINMWHGTLLWFGNLLLGYDDLTFSQFEKETGLSAKVEHNDPERFSKRYAFVMENAKEAFIAWRCKKVASFIGAIRDTLRRARADLKLGITLWNETSMHGYLPGKGHLPSIEVDDGAAFGNVQSLYDVYREGGLDLSLLGREEGIELSVEHSCSRDSDRYWRAHRHEDFAFLDTKTADALRSAKSSTGFNFNCWIELRGGADRLVPFNPTAESVKQLYAIDDFKPDGYLTYESFAPKDTDPAFHFAYGNAICAAFPSGEGFAEFMSMDLAQHDALSITAGGLYIDKSHAAMQLAFAREYRRLPAVRFTDFPTAEGPVTARYHFDGEKTYIYAVNREPYALPVAIKTDGEDYSFTLPPFMLKVIVKEGKCLPLSVRATPPEAAVESYRHAAKHACEMLKKDSLPDTLRSAAAYIKARLSDALEGGRYDEVRHLIQAYVTKTACGQGILDITPLPYL